MRKPPGDGDVIPSTSTTTGTGEDNGSLEQRMQYMIDMQYAYTESFRQDQEGAIADTVVLDAAAVSLNQHNNSDVNENGIENNNNNNNNNSNGLHQSESDADLNVGRGQLIFSNTYYQQQHLHLQPPSMNQNYNGQPMYEGYNAIDTTRSMIDTDPDRATDDQPFLNYLNNNSHDATAKNLYHNNDNDDETCCCCCCLLDPILHALRHFTHADSLHRSFCYAAIDGMLTGAGLIAALVGFVGPLTVATIATTAATSSSSTIVPSPWMVAVCFTACTADALCMAVGHVWNTHVVSALAARDRREERLAFSQNRQESKARLVDRLLSRGMLKIDAVSIADTLEGYPDIFVGALVGDAVVGMPQHDQETNDDDFHGSNHNQNYDNNNPRGIADNNNYRSYGQFREWDHDPDAAGASAAVAESQIEAMVMCVAFSLFGTLPAALYYGASCWVMFVSASGDSGDNHESTTTTTNTDAQQSISAQSVAMTLACTTMWFLGVWKR